MSSRKSKNCLNCNAEINDSNYCHNCGQENSHKHLSVKQLFSDFLGDYLTFDSKLFHSLFPLLFKPGHLTEEYSRGRRNRYIFPLRLYVFTTFVFFFVLTLNNKFDESISEEKAEQTDWQTVSKDSLVKILEEYSETIPNEIRNEIITKLDSAHSKSKREKESNSFLHIGSTGDINFDSTASYNHFTLNDADFDSSSFMGIMTNHLRKKFQHLSEMGEEGSKVFQKEMINQIPKVMFFLLPIFALILKLIFIRHKIYYLEHLIFSLHIHTLVFLLLTLLLFFENEWFLLGLFLTAFSYLFFAIKNFYQQSLVKSFVKMILLIFSYTLCLIPGFLFLLFLAVVSI